MIQLFAELEPDLAAAELAAIGWPAREVAAELIARLAGGFGIA